MDQILVSFIAKEDIPTALYFMRLFTGGAVSPTPSESRAQKIHPYVSFVPGSNGGMMAMNTGFSEVDIEVRAKKIVGLLKSVNSDDLSAEFFIVMLKVV